MKSIVDNLKDICRQKGLSLTDVANRMGTSPSNLLSSVKGNPTISKIQDIADALQISPAELLTKRPESALGLVIIDGQTYQLAKPAASAVQVPIYRRYDVLRSELKHFIKAAVYGDESTSKMGMLDTLEYFSLVYDRAASIFLLSLCYSNGRTATCTYDKMEFCNWKENDTEETVQWDLDAVIEEIINDVESYVPCHLHPDAKPAKPRRKGKDDIEFDIDELHKEIKEFYGVADKQEE